MKYFKKIFIIFISLITIFFIYDLIDYDSNYLNRSKIFFDKNNLNSRYSKKIYTVYKNLKNKIEYSFFWEIEKNRPGTLINNQEKIFLNEKFETDKINIKLSDINFENWNRSNGNNNSTRFSFLKDIDTTNVNDLEVAWTYKSNDGNRGIQANAIYNNGKLYFPTAGNSIVCLNAATGKEIWKYQGSHWKIAQRGLVLHKINNDEFIYFTDNNKLKSINAKNGKLNNVFGKNGSVKIKPSVVTPVIYKNKIIVATFYPSIEVYDLATGKILWKYFLRNKDEKFKGGNPWGGISLDNKRGVLFITTGNPENYFIGVDRPGQNEYTNSVIAIDIDKKKELWKFQETEHDLWNLDIPAAPILTTINYENNIVDVVVAITKLGNTLIFDRETGTILNKYINIQTRSSQILGEKSSTYQKYFIEPENFSNNNFLPSDVFSINKKEQKNLKNFVKKTNYGIFPPFEIGKKSIFYNFHGGAEWTGASVDPINGIMYVTANNIPWIGEITRETSLFSFNYRNEFKRFLTKDKYPASKPPWGTLSAINLNNQKIIWQKPLGNYPELNETISEPTGTENFGGATATISGLVFVSGTIDKKIRAFNSINGKELWSYLLPNAGSAPPTIYKYNGDQYVFIPATGGNTLSSGYPHLIKNSDHFIAFKLKR